MSIPTYLLIAIACIAALLLLVAALPIRSRETPAEAADVVERFLRGEVTDTEWDEFSCARARDPIVNAAKQRILELERSHAIDRAPTYLDDSAMAELERLAHDLRGQAV